MSDDEHDRRLAELLTGSSDQKSGSVDSYLDLLSRGLLDPYAGGLASLPPPPPPPIRERWFKDQTINIDGYTFEGCRFDRCKLVTKFATFKFRSCYISPECGIFFEGNSLRAAQLLLHVLTVQGRIVLAGGEEGLLPVENPDGTFSLE